MSEESIMATGAVHSARLTVDGGFTITIVISPSYAKLARAHFDIGDAVVLAKMTDAAAAKQAAMEEPAEKPSAYVKRAGQLARDEEFWEFADVASEQEAAEFIREHCQVASRADLATDKIAQHQFGLLVNRFNAWRNKQQEKKDAS